jgi:glyoxylase-like metal-dependent hydrolase (beta-lactamase superfamily II)
MILSDETRVLPGHGPETTIGRERATNPFLG